MKLSFIILPAIFFSAALFALEWMPLEEFNDLTRQGNTLVLSEDFENDIKKASDDMSEAFFTNMNSIKLKCTVKISEQINSC